MPTAMPKRDIDEKQHREVSADPRGGVFQHLSGHGHLAFSDQADESIAQVLAADQEEHHENDDDAGRAQHLDQRAEDSTEDLQWARRRGKHANRVRPLAGPLRRLGLFRLREILADVLGGSCYLAQRGDEVVIHRMEFRLNVVLVLRHFGGQVGHLNHGRPYHDAQHREAQECRNQHRRNTAQPAPLEPVAHRAEQEAQQHGQRQGNQHALGQVKGRNDHGDRRQHPR